MIFVAICWFLYFFYIFCIFFLIFCIDFFLIIELRVPKGMHIFKTYAFYLNQTNRVILLVNWLCVRSSSSSSSGSDVVGGSSIWLVV